MTMPAAAEALEKERKKLEDKKAWLCDKVRSKQAVMTEARKKGTVVHFGSLMDLCFEKHSEQTLANRKYKGRVVFRGDDVRDEEYRRVHSHGSPLGGVALDRVVGAEVVGALDVVAAKELDDRDRDCWIGEGEQVDPHEQRVLPELRRFSEGLGVVWRVG